MVARLCDYMIDIALLSFIQRKATRVYDISLWNVKQSRTRARIRLCGKLVPLKNCDVEWRFHYNSRERERERSGYINVRREIISSQNSLKCARTKRRNKTLSMRGSAYRRKEFDKRGVLLLQMLTNCNWENVHDPRVEIFMIDREMRATTAGFNDDMRDAMLVLQ